VPPLPPSGPFPEKKSFFHFFFTKNGLTSGLTRGWRQASDVSPTPPDGLTSGATTKTILTSLQKGFFEKSVVMEVVYHALTCNTNVSQWRSSQNLKLHLDKLENTHRCPSSHEGYEVSWTCTEYQTDRTQRCMSRHYFVVSWRHEPWKDIPSGHNTDICTISWCQSSDPEPSWTFPHQRSIPTRWTWRHHTIQSTWNRLYSVFFRKTGLVRHCDLPTICPVPVWGYTHVVLGWGEVTETSVTTRTRRTHTHANKEGETCPPSCDTGCPDRDTCPTLNVHLPAQADVSPDPSDADGDSSGRTCGCAWQVRLIAQSASQRKWGGVNGQKWSQNCCVSPPGKHEVVQNFFSKVIYCRNDCHHTVELLSLNPWDLSKGCDFKRVLH
jgi:hypothetical protein